MNSFSDTKGAFRRLIYLHAEGTARIISHDAGCVLEPYCEHVAVALDPSRRHVIAASGARGLIVPVKANHVADPVGRCEFPVLTGEILARL